MIPKKFESETIGDLHDLAAKCEGEFPPGLRDYNLYAEEQLANGRWPSHWIARSRGQEIGSALGQAILQELRILFCRNDPKYRDVAAAGKNFSQKAIAAVAGYIAASFGIEIALAASAVAASMLLVARVGTEAICRALDEK